MADSVQPPQGMSLKEEIVYHEAQTWEALKQSGKAIFPLLDPACVMIFPGGTIFDQNSEPTLQDILNRPDIKPWTRYEMDEVRVLPLGAESAMICYAVEAQRGKEDVYDALISSVWKKSPDGWRMVLHQQTPVHVR